MMTSSNGNIFRVTGPLCGELHQPRLWFITGGYLVKRWFLPAAARARGQSNDLNREILASNHFHCSKEVIHAPPVPPVSRYIHIVYRHKNICEYQWSNFIYNCISTFLHYARCKDALIDCSAPGGERCESLTGVDEIHRSPVNYPHKGQWRGALMFSLICARINDWVNNREACDLRRHRPHYDVTVMKGTQYVSQVDQCEYGVKIRAICHARNLWKLARSCEQLGFLCRPMKFARYCLTLWISNPPVGGSKSTE